tara:strand:- start:1832 stop:2854 length:1023 start_codon:yes stop_codon:yes gene_type:complete
MGVRKNWFLNSQQWLWLLSTAVSVVPSTITHFLIQLLYPKKIQNFKGFWIISLPLFFGLIISFVVTLNLYFAKSLFVILCCLMIYNYHGIKTLTLSQKRFLTIIVFGSLLLEAVIFGFIGRFDGIIKGYDFVVLFYVLLIFDDQQISPRMKFLLSPILLLSGRFGFLVGSILLILKYLRKYILYFPVVAALLFTLPYVQTKVNEYVATFQGTVEFLRSGRSDFFDSFAGREDYVDGYFGSPMVLISEYKTVLAEMSFWPSVDYIFYDSGPSYVFANMGLLLGILYYSLYYKLVYAISPRREVMFILIIIDLKFHLSFVPWTLYFLKMIYDKENNSLPSHR